jgi:hypothetical protein
LLKKYCELKNNNMYFNKRKTQNIQKSNLILEQRYLKEQAPPPPAPAAPAPADSPTTPSSSSTRTPIKPMVKASGPKSIKGKDGKVIEWEKQTEDQKKNVATKCGHKSVDEYEKSEWKCAVQEVK